MRVRVNLALSPAAARRRATLLGAAAIFAVLLLSASHAVWWLGLNADPAELRGRAALLSREASVRQADYASLVQALEPPSLRDLSDRVGVANDLILRRAVDPVELLAAIERAAPAGFTLQQISITGRADGLSADLTVRVPSPAVGHEFLRNLRADTGVRDISPVQEASAAPGHQLVLTVAYAPDLTGSLER